MQIKTRSATKEVKKTPGLTKKQMDQLLEAAMSNLQDLVDEGAKKEIQRLKKIIIS